MAVLPHEKQIIEYEKTLAQLRQKKEGHELLSSNELKKLEKKLEKLKEKVYSKLSPLERLDICRHSNRPRASDYFKMICDDFTELCGDRAYSDDRAIIGGLATIGGQKFMVIGQEKGHDTESRVHHNFGMPHPEGFRKALRLMQLAEKFHIPVLCVIDTPGAFPGLAAEERGQAWAIAMNLREMARLQVPIIKVIIGEASSGGALAIGVGDRMGMLEHGYYSVISPEGCASILYKDASRKGEAANALKLNAENLLEFEVIEEVIPEPLGGAHHDPETAAEKVKAFVVESWNTLKTLSVDELLEQRYQRFRKFGRYANT